PVELLDEVEVAAELQQRVLADRVVRGEKGTEFETRHDRGLLRWLARDYDARARSLVIIVRNAACIGEPGSSRSTAASGMARASTGWRAISSKKSTTSSASKVHGSTATTVALRGAPVNNASSPKKSPAPSWIDCDCSCTATSPSTIKYMQSPG